MIIFNVILGVLAVLSGVQRIAFPGVGFMLDTGWIVAILLMLWGVNTIAAYYNAKELARYGVHQYAFAGGLGLLGGILAVVVSVMAMFSSEVQAMLTAFVLAIFGVWLLIDGISTVLMSVRVHRSMPGAPWIPGLVLGILLIVAAVFAIFDWVVAATTIDTLFGILLIMFGVRLISTPMVGGIRE